MARIHTIAPSNQFHGQRTRMAETVQGPSLNEVRTIPPIVPLVLFGMVVVPFAVDLTADFGVESLDHIVVEASAMLLLLVGLAYLLRQWVVERRNRVDAVGQLQALSVQGQQWQAEARRWRCQAATFVQGLGAAIDVQFTEWGLTEAERDIAFLLLKGLTLKEIAALRFRSEHTIRQQANSVYKKGGLAGRRELASYFLEDLLPPRTPAAAHVQQ